MAAYEDKLDSFAVQDPIAGDGSGFNGWTPQTHLPTPITDPSGWIVASKHGTNRSLSRSSFSGGIAIITIGYDAPGIIRDQQVLALASPGNNLGGVDCAICLRGTGLEGSMICGTIDGSNDLMRILHVQSGIPFDTFTTLASVAFVRLGFDFLYLRMQAQGDDYKLKVWPYGDAEPSDWSLEVSSSLRDNPGWTGIGSATDIRLARFKVETDPVRWPVSFSRYPQLDSVIDFSEYALGDLAVSGMDKDFDQPHLVSATREVIDTLPDLLGGGSKVYHINSTGAGNSSRATRYLPGAGASSGQGVVGVGEDMEIVGLVRVDTGSGTGVGVRYGGESGAINEYGHSMSLLPGNQVVSLSIGPNQTILNQYAFVWSLTNWYWMKLQQFGSAVKGRVWAYDVADPTGLLLEPATWLFEETQRRHVDGRFVMASREPLHDQYWDRLAMVHAGSIPPLAPEVSPEGYYFGDDGTPPTPSSAWLGGRWIRRYGTVHTDMKDAAAVNIVASLETNPLAPMGFGGEAIFDQLRVTVSYGTDMILSITPIVDDVERTILKQTISRPRIGPDKITETFEFGLFDPFIRDGVERFRVALRGTSIRFIITAVDSKGTGGRVEIDGAYLRWLPVRESQALEVAT